ncbi:dUTP diphosphatase [Aerococcus urinae]|uniref:dUTP diphosphatase n=1 Tax=Aerococcus mictus TaxID=2976810 RepID=A0A9Q4DD48_9LACT|nr:MULTISPECIES: dUTP diphosphatase [Aerococcus]KAA9291220.1 dUTP diphosphatase [Aerococcus mictus]MBU5611216.1 dUTP diphosphatase [Aerococcus urinae]MCY3064951.1 dUTP diphosphatase [Aerococcus mictus]MCY3077326.1 dUTP diphosphatase [Aerococcus mictus]MCY3081425.1 dUTP diphosphatase [Aerococcus mictus]
MSNKILVPQVVATWIENRFEGGFEQGFTLKDLFFNNHYDPIDERLEAWLFSSEEEENIQRQKILLEAIVNGYEVRDDEQILRVKRLTNTAKLPTKAHETDAGFDIYADQKFEADENSIMPKTVSTGIAIKIPDGYYGRLVGRSGLTSHTGLRVHEGIIDSGYTGELKVMCSFVCPYAVNKGNKIAQLIIQPLPAFEVLEVDELPQTDRNTGGFGSTGV